MTNSVISPDCIEALKKVVEAVENAIDVAGQVKPCWSPIFHAHDKLIDLAQELREAGNLGDRL